MNRTDLKIDKPVCLDLLIVDISKIFMYEYLHDYIKCKYRDKTKLCFTDRYRRFYSLSKI